MLKIAGRIDEKRVAGSPTALKSDLDYFRDIGLEAVEIPVHGLNVLRHGILDRKLLKEAVRILRGYDFTFSVHAPDPVNLMDTAFGNLHQTVMRSTMEFADQAGANVVVCHAGQYMPHNQFPTNKRPFVTKKESVELLAREAAALRALADEYPHINIAVENARPYLLHSPYCYAERTGPLSAQMLDVDRSNVGVNLDVGHLYLAAKFYGFDLLEEVRRVQGMIIHCHVHDNFGLPSYYHEKEQAHLVPFGRGDCHMPVGWGQIPIEEILAQFVPGFEGILVMELRGRYYEWVPESLETLREICLAIGCLPNLSAVGE